MCHLPFCRRIKSEAYSKQGITRRRRRLLPQDGFRVREPGRNFMQMTIEKIVVPQAEHRPPCSIESRVGKICRKSTEEKFQLIPCCVQVIQFFINQEERGFLIPAL